MKAIGFKTSLPIEEAESFVLFEKEKPVPTNRDLLVKIDAVSVNPVDFKIRQNSAIKKATACFMPAILINRELMLNIS